MLRFGIRRHESALFSIWSALSLMFDFAGGATYSSLMCGGCCAGASKLLTKAVMVNTDNNVLSSNLMAGGGASVQGYA